MSVHEIYQRLIEAEEEHQNKKGLTHVLVIDCPDCGRQLAYSGKCGKCGGGSWLPAGYVNRKKLRQLLDEVEISS